MMRPRIVILLGLVCTVSPDPVLGQAQDRTALAKDVEKLLKKHCHQCHGQDGSAEGGFNYILNRDRLVEAGKIVPMHADKSKVFKRVRAGAMPPEDTAIRPTKEEIALLKQWIDAGAPNFAEVVAVRPMIRPEDMPRLLYADLQNVEERDRRFTRYFTLSHLYNARLSEDELQSYRAALAKLVNSLSWGRKIVVPKAIDPAKTIFRIDLRDYQWTPEIWEALLHRNPYGILYETNVEKDLQHATQTQLPHVRGDWFVSDASRPPLYHELLQVPTTVQELEKLLRLDAEQNIKAERVARAAFNGSGVSRSNRLIERHESGYGAYWKSYDFAANTGRQNIFGYPLGAGATVDSFQHDGGEMIFALPNGLHGYMLTNSQGKRLDKGPIEIVSDPKRVDRAVINGLSCMTCHTQGIIAKEDLMRPYLDKNPDAFQARELEAIKALYPVNKKLAEIYEDDQKSFREAVAKTGAVLTQTEPVSALATLFEQPLTLTLCVAELGLTEDELPRRLQAASGVRRVLGTVLVPGGTVQRDLFAAEFANVVKDLRLGRPVSAPGVRLPHDLPGMGHVPTTPKGLLGKTVVELPGAAEDVCVGGDGRYMLLHLKRLGKLAVFDAVAAKVLKYLPAPADALCAASMEHILIVISSTKMIERWSLRTLEREAAARLPVDFAIHRVTLGDASHGPLFVWGEPRNTTFIDLQTLKSTGPPLNILGNVDEYDQRFDAAADNSAIVLWSRRIPTDQTPQFHLVRLDDGKPTYKRALSHLKPVFASIDAGPLFTGEGFVYNVEMQRVPAPELKGATLLPIGRSYVVAVHWKGQGAERQAKLAVHFMNGLKQAFAVGRVEELDSVVNGHGDPAPFSYARRIQFVPAANVLLTVPASNDRVVVRRLDVEAELKKCSVDFLFVASNPVRQAAVGKAYVYQIEARAKSNAVNYELVSGPKGMTLSRNGLLTWNVPEGATDSAVIVAITDGTQTIQHSFSIRVR